LRGSCSTGKQLVTLSQLIKAGLGVVTHACHLNYAGSLNRRTVVQAGRGIKIRPYSKNTAKRAGDMGQVVSPRPQVQNPVLGKKKKRISCLEPWRPPNLRVRDTGSRLPPGS
jgi:hypothetical protein